MLQGRSLRIELSEPRSEDRSRRGGVCSLRLTFLLVIHSLAIAASLSSLARNILKALNAGLCWVLAQVLLNFSHVEIIAVLAMALMGHPAAGNTAAGASALSFTPVSCSRSACRAHKYQAVGDAWCKLGFSHASLDTLAFSALSMASLSASATAPGRHGPPTAHAPRWPLSQARVQLQGRPAVRCSWIWVRLQRAWIRL